MKKLISAMLCLAILVGVLAFAGCKQKNNDETTVPPNTDAAIDNIVSDDTEPAPEDTTQSAQPGQPVQPAKPAQQIQPTKPASKKPVATTQKPEQAVKPTPSKPTIPKPDVKEDNWKPAGTYLCNRDIAADTYYIRPSKKDVSGTVTVTDGKNTTKLSLSYGLFVQVKKGYTLTVTNGEFLLADDVGSMKPSDGVYERGVYRIGKDIDEGEYIIGEFGNADFSVLNSVDFLPRNSYAVNYENYRFYISLKNNPNSLTPYYIVFNQKTKVISAKDRTGSQDQDAKKYGEGTYLVGDGKNGEEIKPGKYTLKRTKDKNGYSYGTAHLTFAKPIGELNVTSDAITIDLKDGQYISFEGFELVEYVEPAPTEPSSEPSSTPSGESSSESKSDADTPKNNEAGDNNKPNNNAGDDKANENKS